VAGQDGGAGDRCSAKPQHAFQKRAPARARGQASRDRIEPSIVHERSSSMMRTGRITLFAWRQERA
jgi:hypothetical protein